MRLIARSTVSRYAAAHPQARKALTHWVTVVEAAQWGKPEDVQSVFSKARPLNAERVRFEIAGGDFRLIAAFDFRRQIAFVKFIGTHAEYDRIDALTESQF